MTQQLAEASGSWRVRFTVALVLLLAAAGTVFSLQKDVSADPPEGATITVDQAFASNFVGQAHTFTFTLPAYVTCESDAAADDTRTCDTSDASIAGDGTVSTVTVATADISVPSTVAVTLNSNVVGSNVVTLLAKAQITVQTGETEFEEQFSEFADGTATKEYNTVAGVLEGVLAGIVHVDSDLFAESEAGNLNGILEVIDDVDQATGSPHYVCLLTFDPETEEFDAFLTYTANAGQIDWIFGGIAVEGVDEFSSSELAVSPFLEDWADTDFPCVYFSATEAGDASVYAHYDPDGPGGVQGVNIYGDGVGPGGQPLVKEWNTIDSTTIVRAIGLTATVGCEEAQLGLVGDDPAPGSWDCYLYTLATDELSCYGPGSSEYEYLLEDGINCATGTRDADFWTRNNVDGDTIVVNGDLYDDGTVFVGESGWPSFIEYTLGSNLEYDGPIDGALQTFTFTGCGSAIVENPTTGAKYFLEGGEWVQVLSSDKGVAFTITPFETDDFDGFGSDCAPGETGSIYIETQEYNNYNTPLDTADDEIVTVEWQARTFPKQPMFLWAGQRAVLEHDWRSPDGVCAYADEFEDDFFNVQYQLQNQSGGSFVGLQEWGGGVPGNDVDITGMDAIVEVDAFESDDPNSDCISRIGFENQDPGEVDVIAFPVESDSLPEADPIGPTVAFLLYYMKFEDLSLSVVAGERDGHNSGDFSDGNPWDTSTDSDEVTANVSQDILVRARVRGWIPCAATQFGGVANCTTREADVDTNGGLLPQWRVVLPDDYRFLAGGALAEELSPNYDVMIDPADAGDDIDCDVVDNLTGGVPEDGYVDGYSDGLGCETPYPLWDDTAGKQVHDYVAGPASLLDGWYDDDSKAPSLLSTYRDTILPDGKINEADWIAPPAEIRISIEGAGFLKAATKGDGDRPGNNVYWAGENPYYVTHIPAEPWINPHNARGGSYEWDSWGEDGEYWFWEPVETGDVVYSAPGADDDKLDNDDLSKKGGPAAYVNTGALLSDDDGGLDSTETQVGLTAPGGIANGDVIRIQNENMLVVSGGGTTSLVVIRNYGGGALGGHPNGQAVRLATGGEETGWDQLYIYSDNHGEAMVWANGDAGLTMDECQDAPGDDGEGDGTVVAITGHLCQDGDLVGESTITASVHYPDNQKHFPIASNEVEVDWEWGGHKYITVEDDPTGQDLFKYVVLHLADRDGYCGSSPSLHPVLGEPVRFVIDGNPSGGIPIADAAELGSITNNGLQADVVTFDTDATAIEPIFVAVDGECQAWIQLSNSLLGVTNVKVTAFDPEGTITWDVVVDFTGESEPQDLAAGWNLVVWPGAAVDPETGLAAGTPDLTGKVSAIYGWIAATQTWLSFFPLEDDIPAELQTLTQLNTGEAYWVYLLEAVNDWTVPTDQD